MYTTKYNIVLVVFGDFNLKKNLTYCAFKNRLKYLMSVVNFDFFVTLSNL